MKTPSLEKSKSYHRFDYHPSQQPLSIAHVSKISASIKLNGFLPSKPVQVFSTKGRYTIIDGHHRFEAAKSIGVEFFFVEEPPENADLIGQENSLVRKWSNLSFVNFYKDKGIKDYTELSYYLRFGFPLACAASLLNGESAHSGNASKLIRTGTFKVKTTASIDYIMEVIMDVEEAAPELRKQSYVEAISMLLFVPEFDRTSLVKKILGLPRAITRVADRKQALTCLEEAYNFKRSAKVNLSFLAEEKMKERHKTYGRK
jgi:hypothetical protein